MRYTECASVTDSRCKAVECSWEEFARRLESPVVVDVPPGLDKAGLNALKDRGGYVGAVFNAPGRKKENLKERTMLAWDIDDADPGTRIRISNTLAGTAYALHTTFSATEDNPRCRVAVPTDRPMTVGECAAVTRAVLARAGIKADDCSERPAQLMFWPVCRRGGYFFSHVYKGQPLAVDSWLSLDPGQPTLPAADPPKQPGKPAEKPGAVGAFNRCFSISQAIARFIPECYVGAGIGRWRYAGSSGTPGAVAYDNDTTLFSNHTSDPARGRLRNAFDLVRIHKYGDLDTDTSQSIEKRPSQAAMEAFALSLPEVAADLAKAVFPALDQPMELRTKKDGTPVSDIANIAAILENDADLKGLVATDDYRRCLVATRKTPWGKEPGMWEDTDGAALQRLLSERYHITGGDKVATAVTAVAAKIISSPFRDWLNGLKWDGQPRLEGLWRDYLGAENSEYTRHTAKMFIVAAVKRCYEPGAKYDSAILLTGPERCGKSSLAPMLCNGIAGRDWSTDAVTALDFGSKDFREKIEGKVMCEAPECVGFDKKAMAEIKAELSKTVDRGRRAYDRYVTETPRRGVLLFTSNEKHPLRGDTGNRRFVVIRVQPGLRRWPDDDKRLFNDREQLWAEAVALYRQGFSIDINDCKAARDEAARLQAEANDINEAPMAERIAQYLDQMIPQAWATYGPADRRRFYVEGAAAMPGGFMARDFFNASDFIYECYGREPKRADVRLANAVLDSTEGWKQIDGSVRIYGKKARGYERERDW